MINDVDAVGFEATLLLVEAAKGKTARKLTLTIDNFVARVEIAVGIAMEDITNDTGELRIAKIFGNLFISDDVAGGDSP